MASIKALFVFISITQTFASTDNGKRCYTAASECHTNGKLGLSVIRGGRDSIATLTDATKDAFCNTLSSSTRYPGDWTCMSDHQTVECSECIKPTFMTGLEKKIREMNSLDKHLTGVTPDHVFCSPFYLGLLWALTIIGALEILYEVVRWREEKPLDPISSWSFRTITLLGYCACYYWGFKKDLEGVRSNP